MGICFSSLVFADPSGGGAEKAELTLTHKRGAQDRKGGALCRLISGLNLEAAVARGSSAARPWVALDHCGLRDLSSFAL